MMQFTDLLPYLGWIIGGAFTLGAGGLDVLDGGMEVRVTLVG